MHGFLQHLFTLPSFPKEYPLDGTGARPLPQPVPFLKSIAVAIAATASNTVVVLAMTAI